MQGQCLGALVKRNSRSVPNLKGFMSCVGSTQTHAHFIYICVFRKWVSSTPRILDFKGVCIKVSPVESLLAVLFADYELSCSPDKLGKVSKGI